MTKKLAIIGSNSFSGSHFVDFALEQGFQVLGFSRSPQPHPVFLPYMNRQTSAFSFIQADINLHLAQIIAELDTFRPEYLVNFASQSMVAESWEYPEHWFQTNCVATVRLHNYLRKCSWLKRYLHVSTPEVYGSCSGLVTEDAPLNPSTPYAVSRAAADMSLMSFYRAYQFPVVFTRAANVFGPGQQLYRIVPKSVLCLALGKKIPLQGGGRSVRSFIHIRDVAEGSLRVLEQGQPPQVYHLSTPVHYTIREVVEEVCRQMGMNFDECVQIVGERLGKDAYYTLDSTRAEQELGWKAHISFEKGVADVIDWVRSNLEVLRTQPSEYFHKP